MTKVEIELFFKGIFATEIEDGEVNYFSNFDEDFTIHRLKGTETLDPDELTQFIKDNLKVTWDGSLDHPQHFKSYNITKMVGPAFASYDVGLNLKSVSLFQDVEISRAILNSLNFFFPKEWGNDRNVARSGRHYRNIETMAPWYSLAIYIGI